MHYTPHIRSEFSIGETLDNRIATRIIDILENKPGFFVPIRDLWRQLEEEGLKIDLEELQRALLTDDRFEITSGMDRKGEFQAGPDSAEGMADSNLSREPCVKLVSREMTTEDIFAGMLRSLERMNQALRSAWNARPTEDQETEDQLLEILAAGQQLEREIQALVVQQDHKDTLSE
jgi:hypothetical protein